MEATRLFTILSWIAIPTVMYGGYSLLGFLARGDKRFSPKQLTFFRAGHAHAGTLLVLSLAYYIGLNQTQFSDGLKLAACIGFFVGILAQSGGFFLHMVIGQEGKTSSGTLVTTLGAVLLAICSLTLAVGLIVA